VVAEAESEPSEAELAEIEAEGDEGIELPPDEEREAVYAEA
jgi:hypothetical protein